MNPEVRLYTGVDRGFIFFENSPGKPWRGITDVETEEVGYRIEKYYVDGKAIGKRHIAGNFAAKVSSYDNPDIPYDYRGLEFGFSYRENFYYKGEEHYRLHIIHGVSVLRSSVLRETVNVDAKASSYVWDLISIDVPLSDEFTGSHLILDSTSVYPWVLRDIEAILYGYPDGDARIPSIDELFDIFETMNLVIIDHGDGTWSAIGHDVMVYMLDSTEFEISSPTIEFMDDEPFAYEIESLIRDERWLE